MTSTNYATHECAEPAPLLFPQKHEEHQPVAFDRYQNRLQKQLDSILTGLKSPTVGEAVQSVFLSLSRLCDILRVIEINASEDGPLPVSLAAFALIDNEAKSLIRFIEQKSSKIKSIKGALRQALDGTSFVLRHELKRVFGQELVRLGKEQKSNQIRADVMRAHGLLSNCFQQSILSLVRVFDPSVSCEFLFDNYRARREQSMVLLKDLSSLMQLAQQAGERRDNEASDLLIRKLKIFLQGPLHYLMYKDWDEFEDIAREVTSSHASARHGFIVHCFVAYLGTLINQVQMRMVLNEQSPASRELKRVRKSRARAR